MSSDNGITINRKTLKAYHWQGDGMRKGDKPIATGETLEEVIDNVEKWIKEQEKEYGYFPLEYGLNII